MPKPILALIPSAYKLNKLYSILPSNGDGDFSFSRSTIATRINEGGLLEESPINTPRLDYTDGGCPDLLLEKASTNLITYSEDFSQAAWSKWNGSTVSINGFVSPKGDLSATELTRGTNTLALRYSGVATLGTEYTWSIWAKKGSYDKMSLDIGDEGLTSFDLTDEWQRFEVTVTPTTSTHVDIGLPSSVEGDNILIFGGQVEEQPHSTSYIPTTSGTGSRSRDLYEDSMLNADLTSDYFTIFLDIDVSNSIGDVNRITLNDGSDNNMILISYNDTTKSVSAQTVNSAVYTNYQFYDSSLSNYKLKMAVVSHSLGISLYVNGVLNSTTTDGRFDASSLTNIDFGQSGGFNIFSGRIKDFRYYNQELTSEELIKLTA